MSGLTAHVLVPIVARAAARLGIVDRPGDARRIHRVPTPRAGGVAVFLAFAVALLGAAAAAPGGGWLDPTLVVALMSGGSLLLVVGLVDDRFGVRPRFKLLGQGAAAALAWGAGLRPDMPLAGSPEADAVLFVLWVVAVTNAFNLVDGMDGLAGSIALVALVAVGVYAVLLQNLAVVLPCALLAAAVTGFLRYNMAPARIFLGDSGSLFVGYCLALLTLAGARQPEAPASLWLALCAIPVPLLDIGAAVARRWLRRVPLSRPDARHIHHQLLALGYQPRGVVAVVYAFSAAVAAFGILVSRSTPRVGLALCVLGAIWFGWGLLYGSTRLNYHEFAEAIRMLAVAPRRARRAIRTEIVARDVAEELARAHDLAAVRQVLARRSTDFGRLTVTIACVCPPCVDDVLVGGAGAGLSVVYPIRSAQVGGVRYALVVACVSRALSEFGTAERVARALALPLESWFVERAAHDAPRAHVAEPEQRDLLPEPALAGAGSVAPGRDAEPGGRGRPSTWGPARARAMPASTPGG